MPTSIKQLVVVDGDDFNELTFSIGDGDSILIEDGDYEMTFSRSELAGLLEALKVFIP